MADRPTLRTLANVLFQAGCQAELLRLIYHEPGRTSEVVEAIALDIQFCAERLEDEIKALEKWGECICAGGPRADVKDPECRVHGRDAQRWGESGDAA